MSLECEAADDLLSVVADDRRRRVLRELSSKPDGVASVEELAESPASQDATGDVEEIALHHAVIPALDEAGLVEYDARSRTVRYRSVPEAERLLAALDELGW